MKTMKKLVLSLFLVCLGLPMAAQTNEDAKYLAGAVTVNEAGYVEFTKEYRVEGKTQGEIYSLLKKYAKEQLVEGPDHLPQARIQDADSAQGLVVGGIEEYLYFKRTPLVNHRVHFYYQIIFTASDGGFKVQMRNLRYLYDDIPNAEVYRAEDWITDSEALNKSKTKLLRLPGKFRRFTIDRKDAIVRGAARATGAIRTVVKEVVVEEEE